MRGYAWTDGAAVTVLAPSRSISGAYHGVFRSGTDQLVVLVSDEVVNAWDTLLLLSDEFVLLVVIGIALWFWLRIGPAERRPPGSRRVFCTRCRYDLTDRPAAALHCAECGLDLSLHAPTPTPYHRRTACIVSCVTLLLIGVWIAVPFSLPSKIMDFAAWPSRTLADIRLHKFLSGDARSDYDVWNRVSFVEEHDATTGVRGSAVLPQPDVLGWRRMPRLALALTEAEDALLVARGYAPLSSVNIRSARVTRPLSGDLAATDPEAAAALKRVRGPRSGSVVAGEGVSLEAIDGELVLSDDSTGNTVTTWLIPAHFEHRPVRWLDARHDRYVVCTFARDWTQRRSVDRIGVLDRTTGRWVELGHNSHGYTPRAVAGQTTVALFTYGEADIYELPQP